MAVVEKDTDPSAVEARRAWARQGRYRCGRCDKIVFESREDAETRAALILLESGTAMRAYKEPRCRNWHLTSQRTTMSKLAATLLELRMRAGRDPKSWATVDLRHGLSLAWRAVENDEHHLMLKRDGVVPSFLEERTVLTHLPDELAPRTRTRNPAKFWTAFVLRKHLCPSCGNALDGEAKVLVRKHCMFCPETRDEKPCRKCGRMVPLKATYTDFCAPCTKERRGG